MCSAVSGNLTRSTTSLTNYGDNIMSEPRVTPEKAIWLSNNLSAFFYTKEKPEINAVVDAIMHHLSLTGINKVYEILKELEEEKIANYGGSK